LSPVHLFYAVIVPAFSAPPQNGKAASPWSMMPLFLAFLAIFYFLMWRPQAKRQKEHKAMLSALKKGDRIVTTGGLHATVLNVKEDRGVIVATISEGVKVEISRGSVAGLVVDKK
jgi:preprotein translocase subunit YajC